MQFRCDNERPMCSNCKTYAQDCVYTERPQKPRCVSVGPCKTTPADRPRPTKARISRLEAENEQLRRHLGRVDAVLASSAEPAGISPTTPRQEPPDVEKTTADTSADRSQSAVSRIFISPNGESSYHGLTSTLFDDAPTDRHGHSRSTGPQVPVEHIRKQLMGDAAYQSMKPYSTRRCWHYLTSE